MLKGAIARRYAEAIFQIAVNQNKLDRTLDDVQGIAQVFSQRKITYLLREPHIPAQRKEKALREALASHVLPTSLNLALLIVQHELVEVMPDIASALEALVLDYKNEAIAKVTTAAQIDEAQRASIKKALEKQTGKKIVLTTRIDPSILGGVVAQVGDQVIDSSIRYRLHALQQQLLKDIATSSDQDVTFLDLAPLDSEPHREPETTQTSSRS